MTRDAQTVTLGELLLDIAMVPNEAASLPVSGLTLDSRSVATGNVFIALRGAENDGHRYIDDAARSGAVAAVAETAPAGAQIPVLEVRGLRQRLGVIAARFYGQPSQNLHVTAVTGTNGKTTVSQLYAQLVRGVGYACGAVGTLGASLDRSVGNSLHTTPDSIALQRILSDWAGEAVPFVSMEASSHALDQDRMNGVEVDTAVFTNLTRDHLDYHGDMQAYGDAKAKLFEFPSLRAAVLNADDPFSAELSSRIGDRIPVRTFGTPGTQADVMVSQLEVRPSGLRFRFTSPWGEGVLRTPLLGAFNAANVVAAMVAALEAGLPLDALRDALERLTPVPGRVQPLRADGAPLVVIDYAHTPDALSQVLATLRELSDGRLIAVFGCGGDRDRGKRELMARAVSRGADYAVITSDNPRSEDPEAIIADVEAGMSSDFRSCADRGEAIRCAIEMAAPGDCVLIAGKGHEAYQIIGDERRSFDDAAVARECLEALAA